MDAWATVPTSLASLHLGDRASGSRTKVFLLVLRKLLIEEPRVVAEIEAVRVRAHIVAGGGFSSFLALFRVADSLIFGQNSKLRFSESPIRSGRSGHPSSYDKSSRLKQISPGAAKSAVLPTYKYSWRRSSIYKWVSK